MKVYLVDDDSEEAEIFRLAVSNVNQTIEVVWYDDVMLALENLLKAEEKPALLFLDLNIPKVSGKQLMKLLRENKGTAEIPVVIYSTSISKRDMDDTAPFGVKAYLQKPENFRVLCDELKELVGP